MTRNKLLINKTVYKFNIKKTQQYQCRNILNEVNKTYTVVTPLNKAHPTNVLPSYQARF